VDLSSAECKSQFVWCNSSPDDELSDIEELLNIEDLHLYFVSVSRRSPSLPKIGPCTSLEVELAHLLKDTEGHEVLIDQMYKMQTVQDEQLVMSDGSLSEMEESSRKGRSPSCQSIHCKYKHPLRPRHSPLLEFNGMQIVDAGAPEPSCASNLQTQMNEQSESGIPYIHKGKWKAAGLDTENFQEICKVQVEVDHEAAK
jgi:hypothetical protein